MRRSNWTGKSYKMLPLVDKAVVGLSLEQLLQDFPSAWTLQTA